MTIKEEIASIKNEVAQVSKISAELARAKETQKVKFWRIVSAIFAVLCLLSNAVWIAYCSQFEKVTETTETITTFEGVEQITRGNGNNNIVGGDFINGEAAD